MDRKGPWAQTYTGKQFWALDPRAEDVFIEDIAHALSMLCRFNGATRPFYSIAEHSILVMRAVSPEKRLKALLHDSPEAYSPFGDVIRPYKDHLPIVDEIEAPIAAAVADAFGLDDLYDEEIKKADNAILIDEKKLMSPEPADWGLMGEPLGLDHFPCWPPFYAEKVFLSEYKKLTG